MQKWEKFLLLSLLILAILGGLIGFAMTKSGLGDLKILFNIDIFGLLELTLLIIVIICAIFDIYETYENKKDFDTVKFKVMISARNRLRNILIFLILVSFIELGLFSNPVDMYMLPLFFITLILTAIFAFHNEIDNGISDNGILHWGIFYTFDDVKSYSVENETLLKMTVTNNFFGFKYYNIIKFDFDKNNAEDMKKFLATKELMQKSLT